MSFSLFPDMILPALTDVQTEELLRRGITLLMLDFDNTIVPYTTSQPTEKMARWLKEAQASRLQICVVSNSKKPRVKVFCQQYGIDCVTHASKPFSKGIRACLQRYQLPPEKAALVGDQIYTDVLGANCAGLTSVLITAIHNHNLLLKARHILELPFIGIQKQRLARRAKKSGTV